MTDRFSFISGRVWVCWPSQSRQLCGEINHCLYNLSCDRPDLRNSALLFPSHTHTHTICLSVFVFLSFISIGGLVSQTNVYLSGRDSSCALKFQIEASTISILPSNLTTRLYYNNVDFTDSTEPFYFNNLFLFSLYNLLYLLSVLLLCLCLVLHYSRLFLSVFSVPSPSVRAIIFISLQ